VILEKVDFLYKFRYYVVLQAGSLFFHGFDF